MSQNSSPPQNHLLSTLSQSDFGLLEGHLQDIRLETRFVLEQPNTPVKQICFPSNGVLSVVAENVRDHPLEVGIIGREGMSGMAVVLGNEQSPHRCYVQIPGQGQVMASDDLRAAMQKSSTLRISLLHFVQAFLVQTAHTATANARAKVEERLARWLLMAHDRIDGDELNLTHEFLALMLGVRRAGVTIAFGHLEQKALISRQRGLIVIEDRPGLEELANGYYGVPEAEYQRLTGWK